MPSVTLIVEGVMMSSPFSSSSTVIVTLALTPSYPPSDADNCKVSVSFPLTTELSAAVTVTVLPVFQFPVLPGVNVNVLGAVVSAME